MSDRVKDISPEMKILPASEELLVPDGTELMGQRAGGLSMFSDVFKRGYGNNVFGSDSNGIWLGAADFADAPFRVAMDGTLIATIATITGMGLNFVSTIVWTATDANTASWSTGQIDTSTGKTYLISSGNTGNIAATTYVYLDPSVSTTVLQTSTTASDAAGDGIILLATVQIGTTECIIDVNNSPGTTIDGGRIATGTITGNEISATAQITAGTGNNVGVLSGSDATYRIWAGHATAASAPFRVTQGGVVYADAYFLNSGNLISVSNGIAAKNTYGINFYNSTNTTLVSSLTEGSGNVFSMFSTGEAEVRSSSSTVKLIANSTEVARAQTDGSLLVATLAGSGGAVRIKDSTALYIGTPGGGSQGSINCGSIDCDSITMNGNNLSSVNNVSCNSLNVNSGDLNCYDLRLKSGLDRFVFKDTSGNERASIRPNGTSTEFRANGFSLNLASNKTAVLPTSAGYRELYCAEAPEVWFFDFVDSKENIDPLFLEVTEGDMKFIRVEGGGYQVWRRRKGQGDLRFKEVSKEAFEYNERFLRMARP